MVCHTVNSTIKKCYKKCHIEKCRKPGLQPHDILTVTKCHMMTFMTVTFDFGMSWRALTWHVMSWQRHLDFNVIRWHLGLTYFLKKDFRDRFSTKWSFFFRNDDVHGRVAPHRWRSGWNCFEEAAREEHCAFASALHQDFLLEFGACTSWAYVTGSHDDVTAPDVERNSYFIQFPESYQKCHVMTWNVMTVTFPCECHDII